MQKSVLVPEIFEFPKYVKYANEMTADVIYSTQYHTKPINRAIFANLHHRPLKLGRQIVLRKHNNDYKNSVPMATHLFPVPTYFILICWWKKNIKWCHQLELRFICFLDHAYQAPLANMKMEHQRWPEKLLILWRCGTQYVSMETKLLSSYCGAHLEESYSKESNISDTNWPRYICLLHLINIWLSVWRHQLLICIF